MSTESDDVLDERLERIQIRAQNFRELLKDGEEVTIAFQDGEVHCEESYRSKFERQHPKLYGRLMSIDAQMAAGFSPYAFGLAIAGVLLVGLRYGESLDPVLVAIPVIVGCLVYLVCRRRAKWSFRRNRAELFELIADANLDRDVLLVMLRDEPDLDAVIHELKLDPGPFPPPTT